jgi:acetyltransferase-like isoleucine patch superfamily enzyme
MGHESVIEDHRFVSARVVVAGRVRIRPCCFIGVNATLRHGITIAPRTLGGAGTVVTEDTVEDGVHLPPRAVLSDRKRPEFDL